MRNIQLFDVDGTLTYGPNDIPRTPIGYKSFGYWPLISKQLCNNPIQFQLALDAWEKEVERDTDPDASSFRMMQRTLKEFFPLTVGQQDIQQLAEEITRNFLRYGIVRLEAIQYLNECLNNNIVCVLTTGSYLDGLQGMIKVLIADKLLSPSPNLILNGVTIDWEQRNVVHCNVGHYKTEQLHRSLIEHNIGDYHIRAAFGDDPYINDKAILELAPSQCAFVIKAQKNKRGRFNRTFVHTSWNEFLATHRERVTA